MKIKLQKRRQLLKFCCLLSILAFLFSNPAKAQSPFVNPFKDFHAKPGLAMDVGTLFSHKDFLLDFGLGYDDTGMDLSIMAHGTFRPFFKKVMVPQSEHLTYQVREKLWQFSLDIEKRFYFIEFKNENKLGLYALGKFGLFWAVHKGFQSIQNSSFTINPGAGFTFQTQAKTRFTLGYLYFKEAPSYPPHLINFKFSLFL